MKYKYKAYNDIPYSCMQTNSNSIRLHTLGNPYIEETDIWRVEKNVWAVKIKRCAESPENTYFRTEKECFDFISYLEFLSYQKREEATKK